MAAKRGREGTDDGTPLSPVSIDKAVRSAVGGEEETTQLSAVPIGDALLAAVPGITQDELGQMAAVVQRMPFYIRTVGEWAVQTQGDKDRIVAAGFPRGVAIALDNWFLQRVSQWSLKSPARNRVLRGRSIVGRDDTKRQVVEYLLCCVATPTERTKAVWHDVWHGVPGGATKCSLLTTSGVAGIGKSAVLSQIELWLKESLNSPTVDATLAAKLSGFETVHVSYNGGCPPFPLPKNGHEGLSFGHHMLRCQGFPEQWMHKVDSLAQALDIVRGSKQMARDKVLIVTVDEIVELGKRDYSAPPGRLVNPTVAELMRHQDQSLLRNTTPTIFVFTSILENYFDGLKTESGRAVKALALPHLSIKQAWSHLATLGTDEDAQKGKRILQASHTNRGLFQLILSCMGHPRALFEGLLENVNVDQLETSHIVTARAGMLYTCKATPLSSALVTSWLCGDGLDEAGRIELTQRGVLQRVDGMDFVLPLILQDWATTALTTKQGEIDRLVGFHLDKAYAADAVLTNTNEKELEHVMVNYEAVRRICRRQWMKEGEETFATFFERAFVGDDWKKRKITMKVPRDAAGIVQHLQDFEDVDKVVSSLQEGYLVVSDKRTEQGMEYVSPFFEGKSGNLIVACVQCKFVSEAVNWTDIGNKFKCKFTAALAARDIEWIPVVYTNHHTKTGTLEPSKYPGVYFEEQSLFQFTRSLGILRMHLEKLGTTLSALCPTLAGSATADDLGSLLSTASPSVESDE